MITAVLLSLLVVAYNNAANRWSPFHSWAYVPLNLAFGGGMTAVITLALDVSWRDIFDIWELADLIVPVALVAMFSLVMFAVATSRHAHRIADRRIEGLRGPSLAFYVLVRIPIGTALVEETVFRGVLLAAWRDGGTSDLVAAICASIAFGLWHIQPTIVGLRMNDPSASRYKVRAAVIGAVLLTTIAGLGLTWLRVWSGGLFAPIVLHAGVNSVAALAAVVASSRKIGSA